LNDVLLIGGGIIPDDDMHALNQQGVAQLFPPGTNTIDIVNYIKEWVAKNRSF
jgi:methylmalonyl-CoA mutase C-terminal domain/subunit